MATKEPQYDLESLKRGVENCDRNIKIFEEAIAKEQKTKIEFSLLIKAIETKQNGNSNL